MIASVLLAILLQLPVVPEPPICRVVPMNHPEPPISCIRAAPDAELCAHRGDPGYTDRWCVFMPVIGGGEG